MGDTLRAPNNQRPANTQIPAVNGDILRPLLPASSQPRKFNQYAESAANANANANANGPNSGGPDLKPKENSSRSDSGYYQNFQTHTLPPERSRHNSTLFLFNAPRHDLFSLPNNYPLGAAPTMPTSAPGQRQIYPGTLPIGRDSMSFGVSPNEMPGRLRGDSICLPHPLSASGDPLNFPISQGLPSNLPPGYNPLRSTSIFSSLIQLPDSSRNSVSGSSSKEVEKDEKMPKPSGSVSSTNKAYPQDYESMGKDSGGNMFGWNQGGRPSAPNTKRNTREYDNQSAVWDQMGTGVTGSIAGVSNDSINAFLANLQNSGSIDFLNMSNEQRRDSIMKFISDQGQRSSAGSLLMGAPLREDIFEDQRKSSYDSNSRRPSYKDANHVSPTSSISSKNSRLRDEPHSPKASPANRPAQLINTQGGYPVQHQHFAPPSSMNPGQRQPSVFYNSQQQDAYNYPYQEGAPQYLTTSVRGNYGQFQQLPNSTNVQIHQQHHQQYAGRPPYGGYPNPNPNPNSNPTQNPTQTPNSNPNPNQAHNNSFSSMFKAPLYVTPDAVEQQNYYPVTNPRVADPTVNGQGKQLVQAQQYARAEDGRPLLGATKVDQLMLVIQAREKGNTTEIKQATDGSILASPNIDHDKNAVLPLTVDLVGGIEKPQKVSENADGEPSKKRRRRGKTQECPYCYKQFHQTTHLDVHVRSHIGLKPFECTYCGKRFTQGGNLRTHMRLHTGEKPFVCEICNRNFSRKGNLAAHMLTHNKEKPYDCKLDNCDKSFTQLGNLKSHQNKFHLPTLTKLTQTFASITGDALAQLPQSEKDLLEYFAKLYKNANKGIRGRGKGKRVAKIGNNGGLTSPVGSTHTSPEQLTIAMARQNDESLQKNMKFSAGAQQY